MDAQEGAGMSAAATSPAERAACEKRVLNAGECLVPDVRVDGTSRRVAVGLSNNAWGMSVGYAQGRGAKAWRRPAQLCSLGLCGRGSDVIVDSRFDGGEKEFFS